MENTGYVKAYTLPAAASWEVDLFGKLLNASRGQKAAYLQSQYTQQAIRSQLIGGIANAYFTLLMLDRQVEITSKTVDIYKENVRAMEAMKVAGMTTEAAVVQMRAVYHQVSGSLIELKRQVREVENSLSVLLAKAPQPIDRSTLEDQVMPEELMAGVPLQLLENRPAGRGYRRYGGGTALRRQDPCRPAFPDLRQRHCHHQHRDLQGSGPRP